MKFALILVIRIIKFDVKPTTVYIISPEQIT